MLAKDTKGKVTSDDELSRASEIIRKKYSRIGASKQQSDSLSPVRHDTYQQYGQPLKRSPVKTSDFNL